MSSLREILDPNQTLPDVRLEVVQSTEGQGLTYVTKDRFDIMENDERIGHGMLITQSGADVHFAHFDGVEIHDPANRGRGIGLATYILAIEMAHSRGFDFETQNWPLTPYAKRVWEHLAAKSIAQVIEPFEPSRRVAGKFDGKYRIPVEREASV